MAVVAGVCLLITRLINDDNYNVMEYVLHIMVTLDRSQYNFMTDITSFNFNGGLAYSVHV